MTQTEPNRPKQILEALRMYWGFDTLRPVQEEVVEAALKDRDAVVVMPTGGGKSLCFQLPAMVTQSLTVVVSPLIALMKDQVDALTVVGVPAAALNSSMSADEEERVRVKLVAGEIRLLYVSPERLLLPGTLQLLARADRGNGVARFAIDEAHCISAWGHDFRPEFRRLSRIKESFPGVSVQAFTATATPQVQRDIAIQLKLERPRRFVGVFDRSNLTYRVVAKDDAVRRTIEAVRRYPEEGVIVYCLSRKDTEAIAGALVAQGIKAVAYHAGLQIETRKKVSEEFAQEQVNIVVATIAFGMGIDRANVRCVIHECLPKSIEGYQQETGRAGRDGLPSECVLLYNHGDVVRLKRMLSDGEPDVVARNVRLLEEVRRFATSHQCRHKSLSEHFGQPYEVADDGCGACDVCEGGMQPLAGSTEIARRILNAVTNLLELGRGRTFGVAFLVSVLNGARVKSVLDRHGDRSAAFGAFASESAQRVASWVHQLADLGLLEVSEGQYPVLAVTDAGRSVLTNGSEVDLVENVALLAPAGKRRSKSSEPPTVGMDAPLFEKLRTWRRSVASERGIPAYVVLHDATLMRIAAVRPSTLERLGSISGIGVRRVEDFGAELIALVREHRSVSGMAADAAISRTPGGAAPTVSAVPAKYAAYFRSGAPISRIAAESGVKPGTVWQHLADWVQTERPQTIGPWVDKATQTQVTEAFARVGSELLKPAFESLGASVPYEVIRVVRAFVAE